MISTNHQKARFAALVVAVLTGFAAGCGSGPAGAAARSQKAVSSAEYRAAAARVLGKDATVLLSGDLARDGHIQLLVANVVSKSPAAADATIVISRAAVVEEDGKTWREVLLADDSLKNSQGFLAGTPRSSVSSWQLRYADQADGVALYFTPVENAPHAAPATIEVRWNPAESRYQSLDRSSQKFLAESPSLTAPPSYRIIQ